MRIQAKSPAKGDIFEKIQKLTLIANSEEEMVLLSVAYYKMLAGTFWTTEIINEMKESIKFDKTMAKESAE